MKKQSDEPFQKRCFTRLMPYRLGNRYNAHAAILFLSLVVLLIPASGQANKTKSPEIELHRMIKMSDGVHLAANIYRPQNQSKPLPAIFTFTPYVSDEGQKWGTFFTQHDYVYLHVDVRGRGNSEGVFVPDVNEGQDGAEVVAWIAAQPWCNGKVGMRGGSYRGQVQWQILKYNPKALKSILPTAAAAPGVDFPTTNNIAMAFPARWLSLVKGKTMNRAIGEDDDYWTRQYYRIYSKKMPFIKLADITSTNKQILLRWLEHPSFDEYWQQFLIPDRDYERIDIPILSLTGFFDGDQPGALYWYRKHMRHGNEQAKNKHYLIIGPWDHPGTRKPAEKLGPMSFGKNSVLDLDQLHLDWFNWTLKGGKKPEILKKRVNYYLMHKNQWEHRDKLHTCANGTWKLFLNSKNGFANDVFHSGFLTTAKLPKRKNFDQYTYNPLETISYKEYKKNHSAFYEQWDVSNLLFL